MPNPEPQNLEGQLQEQVEELVDATTVLPAGLRKPLDPAARQSLDRLVAGAGSAKSELLSGTIQKEQGKAAKATSASEWRKNREQGELLTLPSGNVARVVRKMSIIDMLAQGEIPNPLANFINKMINNEEPSPEEMTDPETLKKLVEWVNEQTASCMIEPSVFVPKQGETDDDCPDDKILIADIDFQDRMFLAGFAQGGPASYQTFREQSAFALASLQSR